MTKHLSLIRPALAWLRSPGIPGLPQTERWHLAVLLLVACALRIPLLDRPPWHDEVYNSRTYLGAFQPEIGYNWATDWGRQIVIHPPLVSAFYYVWIRIVGETAVLLHVPTLISGLLGVIELYWLASLLAPVRVAFFSALALAVSGSHIGYSVSAVHAIFESTLLLTSLICLYYTLRSPTNARLGWLLGLNALTVSVFYHGFVFLLLEGCVLWRFRTSMPVPRWYIGSLAIVIAGFALMVVSHFGHPYYDYSFWEHNDLRTLLNVLLGLPFREV